MVLEPNDVGEIEKALNDAAGQASALWTTFITFELYLAIAFGSVTHRDIFLETPVKLPLLNVDLPLIGFFVVAPTVLLIFHFYVFMQLLALAAKAIDYETLLRQAAVAPTADQYLRQRLNSFLILQFLAGPAGQRTGFPGFSLRLIAWITLVGAPVLILLQAQLTFLPYHKEWIVWLQRIEIFIDLAVIWYFWDRFRSGDDRIVSRVPSESWQMIGIATSFCVALFSVSLATFPGEPGEEDSPLRNLLFAGQVDEVSGRPRSLFSNRLVLTDQTLVDFDKIDKVDVSRSLRGRDLRQAVFNRADLRKADFTGAMLNGAEFREAKLQNAHFGCGLTGTSPKQRQWPDDGCTWLQKVEFSFAQLQGASLDAAALQGSFFYSANLTGASFRSADLQGATFDNAALTGASFDGARLTGASFDGANLQKASFEEAELMGASFILAKSQGASYHWARLQGASFDRAQLQCTLLEGAWLQGALLKDALLQGAGLDDAHLDGASLEGTQLQGSSLDRAQLQGASLKHAMVWRTLGKPTLKATDVSALVQEETPWAAADPTPLSVDQWRKSIAGLLKDQHHLDECLSALDPAPEKAPSDAITAEFWEQAKPPQNEKGEDELALGLGDLACSSYGAPYVARGLLQNGRLAAAGKQIGNVAARMRKGRRGLPQYDPSSCLGVDGFTDKDWTQFDDLVAKTEKVDKDSDLK